MMLGQIEVRKVTARYKVKRPLRDEAATNCRREVSLRKLTSIRSVAGVREDAMNIRRYLLVAIAITLFVCAADRMAHAQNYPVRPVKLIVPYAAGGPNDIVARLLAQKLQEALGGNFFVEN